MTVDAQRVRIETGNGKPQLIPLRWFKLLLRLRQLPDGCHTITLIKDGDECRWSVTHSGKVEG